VFSAFEGDGGNTGLDDPNDDDLDPDGTNIFGFIRTPTETPLEGITPAGTNESLLFMETMRDVSFDKGNKGSPDDLAEIVSLVTAHEIGHILGGSELHNRNGIMQGGAPLGLERFEDITVSELRDILAWGS
jgi:hypothetical protein